MTRYTKRRNYLAAAVRVVFAVACLAVTPWLLASRSGGMFVSGAGLLGIGVTLLVAPAFAKEGT